MIVNRPLLALLLLVSGVSMAQGPARPKRLSAAALEARNEIPAPSFSGQVREAQRIAYFLTDALLLSYAQSHAVASSTATEREALALAVTATDTVQVQQQYRRAVRRVLTTRQLQAYVVLCRQLAGTVLPLDGAELAIEITRGDRLN